MPDRPAPSGGAPTPGGSRNRKWLVVIGATPLVVAAVAAAAYLTGPSEPSVHLTPPGGYQAVTDAYFAYAIPVGWAQDASGTDSNGDFYYRGRGGWLGETLRVRAAPPVLGEPPPPALGAFGQIRATPYQLMSGAAATVPGADTAWRYELQRAGSPALPVIDAWVSSTRTEIWLVVQAGAGTSSTILSSLRA